MYVLGGCLFLSMVVIYFYFYKKQGNEINELSNEVSALREENKKRIEELKEEEDAKSLYPNIPKEWNRSVYNYKVDWINSIANANLALLWVNERLNIDLTQDNCVMVLYCKMVTSGKNGMKLLLQDPHNQIWSEPFNLGICETEAYSLADKILIIHGNFINNKLVVKRVQKTKYGRSVA